MWSRSPSQVDPVAVRGLRFEPADGCTLPALDARALLRALAESGARQVLIFGDSVSMQFWAVLVCMLASQLESHEWEAVAVDWLLEEQSRRDDLPTNYYPVCTDGERARGMPEGARVGPGWRGQGTREFFGSNRR